jgi:chitodextrinase
MSKTILKSSVLLALAVALNVLAVPSAYADTDTTPPSVPTQLAASVNCDLQLRLTWTASTDNVGVTGYDVFRLVSTPGNFVQVATVTTTTYTEQRLTSTQYEVRARDAAGNTSAFSTPAFAVPPPCPAPDTQPPTTPGTPTVTTACGSATLTWTPSTDNFGVTGYEIWQAPGTSGGTFTQVATTTTTSYTVTGVAISRIQIRAHDRAGNVSSFTPPVTVAVPACPVDTQPPTMPGPPTASGVTASQVTLSWTASTDNSAVTGYDIYRATGASGGTFASAGTAATTTFTDTGLAAATTYRYQVRARDAAGNTSDFSPTVTVTTPSAGGACSATLTLQSAWSTGYVAQPNTVTNTGSSTLNGWTVTFTLPPGHTIVSAWNAVVTVSGQTVTARGIPGQNGILIAGASTNWGFQATTQGGTTVLPVPTCTSP